MNTEYEIRILEIDKKAFISKLEELGAKKVGEFFQKRFVYDFNPVDPNKWIRLRTNGKDTTLTIKEITKKNDIAGTKELEVGVSDFQTTNKILNKLGYVARNYQENKRVRYMLNNVEIDIDTWPLIPAYVELEGKDIESVNNLVKILHVNEDKITSLDVASIYNEIYNIDILSIKKLEF